MRAGITRLMINAKKFGAFFLAGYSVAIDKLEVWLKFLNNTKFSSFLGEIERSPLARMVAFLLILATFIQISVDFDDRVDERRMRQEERRANDEERIARAWSALTTFASGNSGKADAIETLVNAGVSLEGIDLSCETMKAGWEEEKLECQRPIILRGIMKQVNANLDTNFVKHKDKTNFLKNEENSDFYLIHEKCFDNYPVLVNYSSIKNKMKFNGAKLSGVDFSDSVIANADFSGADLRGAIFDNAVIIDTIFDKTNLNGAKFTNTMIFNSKFNIVGNYFENEKITKYFKKISQLNKNSKFVPIKFENSKIYNSVFVIDEKGNGMLEFWHIIAKFNRFIIDSNEFDKTFTPFFADSSELECSVFESGRKLMLRNVDVSGSYFNRKKSRADDGSTLRYGFWVPTSHQEKGDVEISGPVYKGRLIDGYQAYFSDDKPPQGSLGKANVYSCKSLPFKRGDEDYHDRYNYDIAIKYCQS